MKLNEQITLETIKQLKPCRSGVADFIEAGYKDFKGTVIDFIKLDKVCYSDKVWVIQRLPLPKEVYQYWALACVSSLSELMNKESINCLKATEDYLKGKIGLDELDELDLKRNVTNVSAYVSAYYNSATAVYTIASRQTQREVNLILLVDVIEDIKAGILI